MRRQPQPGKRPGRERGQATLELVGITPILILVALAAVQLGLAIYAVQQAGTASRAAARTASHSHPGTSVTQAGRDSMSDWLAKKATFTQSVGGQSDEVEVTAKVPIPSIVPGLGLGTAERTVTMPRD
ncbi:TadE family protein [Streptomyces sp. NPDC005438]|uniref:TadE family protein n=1 Tax=Streptomyces sp. NPDC005438 TaxID=3156880 RepID=UPI0033B6E8B2